jgi:hypothetical protein
VRGLTPDDAAALAEQLALIRDEAEAIDTGLMTRLWHLMPQRGTSSVLAGLQTLKGAHWRRKGVEAVAYLVGIINNQAGPFDRSRRPSDACGGRLSRRPPAALVEALEAARTRAEADQKRWAEEAAQEQQRRRAEAEREERERGRAGRAPEAAGRGRAGPQTGTFPTAGLVLPTQDPPGSLGELDHHRGGQLCRTDRCSRRRCPGRRRPPDRLGAAHGRDACAADRPLRRQAKAGTSVNGQPPAAGSPT